MSDDIVQEAIKSLEDWDTCYSQNEEMRDAALAALKGQANEIEHLRAENEKLHRESAIRIDQIEREQEAHLRTISDYNRAAVENEKLLKANLSLRDKYLRLQLKLGRIAKVLDEPTVAAAAIRETE